MKRAVNLLFALIMTVNLFNFTVAGAHTGALSDDERTLLDFFGVIDTDKELDDYLTRGEFAIMLAKVAFGVDADVSMYNTGKCPTDVSSSDPCYDAVSALYSKGYIALNSFGYFYPDNAITPEEATDMAVGVMGYSNLFLKKIFSQSTQSIAADKGLYKGISAADNTLSLYNAYKLIYNMLRSDVSDLVLSDENKGEIMYMSSRLFVYEISGVVTDDGFTSLYGATEIGENQISIDGKVLENGTGYSDLLGYNVKGYYEYSRFTDEATLLAIGERSRKNDVTVLYSEDIEDFKNRVYEYYDDEYATRTKKTEIPRDAVIIYNGKSLTIDDEFKDEMFLPKSGRVTLHDNDGDGKINIVKIDDFKTGIVYTSDINEEKIYLKNGIAAIELEDKSVVIEDKDGNTLKQSELSENNVVTYMQSLDGEYVKILVSTFSQEETVTAVEREDGYIKSIDTEAGGTYEMSLHAQTYYDKVDMRSLYVFYFDVFDKVAGFEKSKSSNEWSWGSLISVVTDEDRADEASLIKIYTEDNEIVNLYANTKITVIDENDVVTKYDSYAVANAVDYTGIIRYKTSDDKVTYIEIPHKYGTIPTTDDRLFMLLDTVETENKEHYYTRKVSSYISYGGKIILNDKTKVFVVPSDVKLYNDYAIGSIDSFINGTTYSMYLYGTNYKSKKAECACLTSGSVSTKVITNETPITIKKVELTYNDESQDEEYKVTCMTNSGAESVYYMEKDVYETEVFSLAAGDDKPVKIDKGDLIYYNVDKNHITAAVLIYDADVALTDEKGNTVIGGLAGGKITYYSSSNLLCNPFAAGSYTSGNTGLANSWMYHPNNVRVWVGWVYSYEDGFIQITNQNLNYGYNFNATKDDGFITEMFQLSGTSGFVTVEKNGKKVNVKKGELSDIRPYNIYGSDCSRVLITQRVYDTRSFSVIND